MPAAEMVMTKPKLATSLSAGRENSAEGRQMSERGEGQDEET